MHEVAKRNDTVRFVRLHGEVADIDSVALPAVLAYQGGNRLATLLPLLSDLPFDSTLSAVSLETLFRRYVSRPWNVKLNLS